MVIITILVAIFLAANMGVSGFSVSFTPSYGSNVLSRNRAVLLYSLAVMVGGLLLGPRIVATLTHKLSVGGQFSPIAVVLSCAVMMFLSNVFNVPQSTSFVVVSAFVGAGLYYGGVNWTMVIKILVVAVIFSVVSFVLTLLVKFWIYPPRQQNMRFYEFLLGNRAKFKKVIVLHDTYAAFAIGTHSVANVVAPIVGILALTNRTLLFFAAPFFGIGAYFFGGKLIHSVSKDIVPVGEFSATIVSIVTASFVIIASFMGLPTPYVQFATFSLLAVSCAKDGFRQTFAKSVVKKIVFVWLAVPLATVALSFGLHRLFLGGR